MSDSSQGEPARHGRHAVIAAIILLLLLVVADIVTHTAPGEAVQQEPFAVDGPVGTRLSGRTIAATVTRVRVTDKPTALVRGYRWTGKSAGTWVVVDVTAQCVLKPCTLAYARLSVGGRSYAPSDRLDTNELSTAALAVGIPSRGSLVFEVPASLPRSSAARHAEVRLAAASDIRLDSLLTTTVDLNAVPHAATIAVAAPTDGSRQ